MFSFREWNRVLYFCFYDHNFLFEAVYTAGIARIYQLNPETGEVVKLIEELEHSYPTGTHERQIIIIFILLEKP